MPNQVCFCMQEYIHTYIHKLKATENITATMNFDKCKKQLMEMLSDFAL